MEQQFKKFQKTYAIDWDGTVIDERQYPKIGEPKPNAIHTMQRILDEGSRIIIWTCRGGEEQTDGIRAKLNEHGIYDFIINDHFPDVVEHFKHSSPKVYADVYIDDRSLFTKKIDWYEIEDILFPREDSNYGDLFSRNFDKKA